jgi:hypothetical protein
LADPDGFVVRRWSRHLRGWWHSTGLKGCNAWTRDERFVKVFGSEDAARDWLLQAETSGEVVPATTGRDEQPA